MHKFKFLYNINYKEKRNNKFCFNYAIILTKCTYDSNL